MSALLLEPSPETVEVDGASYPIHSDFRAMVRFECLLTDSECSEEEQLAQALTLFYAEHIPGNIPAALDALLWFYHVGEPPEPSGVKPGGISRPLYSFSHDDALIFAAFWTQYRLDLTRARLHWWKFRALFRGLSDDTEFVKAMGYRAMEIPADLPARQREFYRKMKQLYQLPAPHAQQRQLDEIDRALLSGGDLTGIL